MDGNPQAFVVRKLLESGTAALNQGRPKEALPYCANAALLAPNDHLAAQAEQQQGICQRLLGDYEGAEKSFKTAYDLAKDTSLRGRIKRDWGMLCLDQGRPDDAMEQFQASLALLEADGLEEMDDRGRHVEYFATMGFIGRAHLAKGDRQAARAYMHMADRQLKGRVPYELNNLVWWLKACSLRHRSSLLPRAWKLARESGNRKRQAQVLLTVVSPLFARLVEARL